jgi:hypothetical protein
VYQLKEELQNNLPHHRMTKMITKEEDCLLSKTRRMSASGVAEQPEDEGQEDSSEGAETAGPLT